MSIFEQFSLQGRVILVTGASSGIGRGIASACAEAGAIVAGLGRDRLKLNSLLEDMQKTGSVGHIVRSIDLTDYGKLADIVSEITASCGKISGFVHAAGIARHIPLKVMRPEDYLNAFELNVVAGMELLRLAITKKNWDYSQPSSVVLISSVSSLCGEAGLLGYSISKGGINAATRSLAIELARSRIRVNALVPGQILDTEMGRELAENLPADELRHLQEKHPLGFGHVDDLVGSALFLLAPASRWMTGATLCVDGGYCL